MAKRGRPRIYPPKTPKGESAATTIGNQDRQINLLINRCWQLESSVNDLTTTVSFQEKEIRDLKAERDRMEESYQRTKGWQDLAREIILNMQMPLWPAGGQV